MTDPCDTIEWYARRSTALSVVLLVAATATASAQPHVSGVGGSMGGRGAVSGWTFPENDMADTDWREGSISPSAQGFCRFSGTITLDRRIRRVQTAD